MTITPAAARVRPTINEISERQVPMMIMIGHLLLVTQLFIQHTRFFDVFLPGFRIPALLYVCFFMAVLISGGLVAAIQTPIGRLWLAFLFWALLSGTWSTPSATRPTPIPAAPFTGAISRSRKCFSAPTV